MCYVMGGITMNYVEYYIKFCAIVLNDNCFFFIIMKLYICIPQDNDNEITFDKNK